MIMMSSKTGFSYASSRNFFHVPASDRMKELNPDETEENP